MRKRNSTIIALALLAMLAPAASAQQREGWPGTFVFETARRAWLGFSYEQTETRRPGERTYTLSVVSVVNESPAARAGLQQGDQILRINNLGASEQLLGSLGGALNPGDTVTLRIRRDGNERDLSIVAAKPPEDQVFGVRVRVDGDSIRQLVRIFSDSMRVGMDTTVFRYLQRGDSGLQRMFVWRDSVMPHFDSVAVRILRDTARINQFRVFGDSITSRFHVAGDSVITFGEGDNVFSFSFPRGEEFGVRPFIVGLRAVGGAELHELNPELAGYFDVEEGVLVMSAAEGTPARRAGLQSGDVITAVNGERATTIREVRRGIERASGKTVQLEVVRQGRRLTLELSK